MMTKLRLVHLHRLRMMRYEESGPSTRRPTQRGRVRRNQMRSRSPQAGPLHHLEPWRTGSDPDTAPQISRFMPRRTPGARLDTHAAYTPLDLFQLYFSPTTVRCLHGQFLHKPPVVS